MFSRFSRLAPLVAALGLVAATCDRSHRPSRSSEQPAAVQVGREFSLRPGEAVGLDGGRLLIRFERVGTDSRCPVDVRCVWEGDAAVMVTVSGRDGRIPIELHTAGRLARPAPIDGYRLHLRRLEPAPRAHVKIEPGEYVAVLLAERVG